MAGSKYVLSSFGVGPIILGFIFPMPCFSAAFMWPMFFGFIFIILQAVESVPTRSEDASMRSIIFDLPFAGPFPSIAIVPSMTVKFGLIDAFMPAITLSNCRW